MSSVRQVEENTKDRVWVSVTGHSAMTTCQTLGPLYGYSLGQLNLNRFRDSWVLPVGEAGSPLSIYSELICRVRGGPLRRIFGCSSLRTEMDRNGEDSKKSVTQIGPGGGD